MTGSEFPSPREFGELVGELRGLRGQVTDLHGMVSDLQRSNAQEHAANGRRFEQMRAEVREGLSGKADKEEVGDIRNDVKKLSRKSNENQGRDSVIGKLIMGSIGGAVTFILSALLGHPVL